MDDLYEVIRQLQHLEVHASHEMVVDQLNVLTDAVRALYERLRKLENSHDNHK